MRYLIIIILVILLTGCLGEDTHVKRHPYGGIQQITVTHRTIENGLFITRYKIIEFNVIGVPIDEREGYYAIPLKEVPQRVIDIEKPYQNRGA